MLHIGGTKMVFMKNVVGIFTCTYANKPFPGEESVKLSHIVEYVTEPPYRSCVIVRENGMQKAYFTSRTVTALRKNIRKNHVL